MIRQDIIQEEDKELYLFGIQQGFALAIDILTFFLIGLCLGMFWQALVYLASFMPIRVNAGGYHARTRGRCYVYSCIMNTIALLIIKISSGYIMAYMVLSVAACVVVWFLAPVEDENKPLDEMEEKVYRHRAHIAICFDIILCAVSSFLSEKIFFCICLAIIANGFMSVTGYVANKRRGVMHRCIERR